MNFNSCSLKVWALILLLAVPGVPVMGTTQLRISTVQSSYAPMSFVDRSSAIDEITVRKRALLNDEPVDEVCGGQTVTFEYTVWNNVSIWPAYPPYFPNPVPAGPLYYVNIQDADASLGDIDGTVAGHHHATGSLGGNIYQNQNNLGRRNGFDHCHS